MISGKFDPPHEGHIDHILKASELGDYLIVVVQRDDAIIEAKGHLNVPYWARHILVRGILLYYGIEGMAISGIDRDGKSTKILEFIKPEVFAKGGDRTPDNMPQDEISMCEAIGCEIIYGVGDLLNSSSKITERG